MDWVERLNQSIRYIEEHLTDEIAYEQLGRIACCSTYHYQRMFTYMAGISLAEYIRRRKMTLAATDLQDGKEKIIDVAAKYGYSSPTAFNRAFQSFHGIAPSALKNGDAMVKSFSPIVFYITVKGATEMNYRIESKEAFRIIGVSAPLDRDIEKNFMVVPGMWQDAVTNGTIQTLAGMMDTPPMGLLGVSICGDAEQWKYFIAVSSTKKMGVLRNTMFLHPHGRSFQDQVIIDLFKSWNGALLPSGFPVPDMNMPMLRISRFI